jgi:PGF-pre-PGF domain-containing protein/PGF-CTERM protein
VKPQHGIAVVLLIALVAGAAAAGGTPPTLPHVFYGNVTIGGAPAPAGTVITAMFGDTNCGSIMVTDAGRYGDPDWRLGNRLLVTGTADQNGETITFLVGGAAAKETAPFTPGAVTRLDLSFEETMTVPVARFTANITSGPAPLTVAFTDTSTGADSRSWDFGDGTTSADQSPTHTYTTPGTYTANLTVANAAGSSSTTATITVLDEGAVEIIRGPYLTGTTTTATVVNWMAQEPVAGTVEYADDTYYTVNGGYEKSVAGTAETAFHHITLEGLAPDTLYHYRVAAGSTTTGDHTFRTFPGDGGFTFVVYGDTQRPANINLVADRIADENPLFVLHTGDQVNGVESAGEWNDFFRYSGRMLGNTTIYTTMGNHEKNHTAYYENFGLPQRYSFTCSDAQFAVLDDNNWVDLNRESAWLKDDLDSDAAWKFVAHHHPPYSSTPERSGGWILLRVWGETMKNAGVSAVFNGHVHAYERYVVGGINYVVAGTGAGPLYQLGDERPEGYQTSLEDTLGYTKVTLYPNGTAVAGFVKVARLSDDANVLEVYPPGSVFETYTMTRPPRADLAAVGLAVPGGATAGTACTVTGTIKNVGDAASRACSATLTAGDRGIGTAAVDALGPGETAEVSFTWTPAAAGEATLTLAVDPAAEIPDVDRTNNARTVTVTVAGSGPGPAPVANFSTNVTEGDAPLTVAFTDESTGAATWSWDFGDGNTSTDRNPVHTYEDPGTYTVTLTVTNAAGSSSATKTVTVTVPVGSIAVTSAPAGAAIWLDGENTGKFTSATLTSIPAGEHVVTLKLDGYADASMPVIVEAGKTASVHLDLTTLTGSLSVTSVPAGARVFIDGADTGAVTNTTIDGIGIGTHTVTLRKDGYVDAAAEVTIEEAKTATLHLDLVEVVAAPVAVFTANVTSGDAPLIIAFTDASTGADSWSWAFGDGNTSTDRNPVHTYVTPGTYTVNLTVTNTAGSSSATKTVTVTEPSGPAPVAGFTADVTSGNVPLAVRFTDTSTGADSWSWSFGDGATSTEQNPVHTYTQVGRFTVTLTVANTGGSSSATGVVTTRDVPPAPKAEENFTLNSDAVNVTTGAGGQQVTINATAGLNVTGNDIHLQTGGLTVTIKTEGLIDNASTGNVTGNVTGVHLESTPVNATVGSAGNISVSFTAEMDNYDPALGITTTIYDQPGDATKTAFALAAQDEGSEIAGIAYAVYFNKSTPTDTIRDAVLRLTVSPGWVAANGGIKAIKIFRLGDDGNRSVLETTYEGMENGMMVFTAVSPEGFSAFALGAVAAPAPAPAPSRSSGGSSQASVGAASNLKLGDRVTFPMDRTAITAITLTADGDVKEVVVTVEKGSLPRDTEAPAGTVYQYIETNLHKAAAGNFSALQIQFAVPTAWLAAQGCTGSQVGLFRHTTDGWRQIPVEVLGEKSGDAFFSVSADAFGLFAIAATGEAPDVEEPTPEPIETGTTPPADVTTPPAGKTTEPTPAPGFGALVALTGLGVVALLVLRRK